MTRRGTIHREDGFALSGNALSALAGRTSAMNTEDHRSGPRGAPAPPARPASDSDQSETSARTAQVAGVIRSAADRLTSSGSGVEPEALAQIAAGLRGFADTLEEDTANVLVEAVGKIARANPSNFLAGSVMAGLALEQVEPGSPEGAAPRPGAGFVEQALNLLRNSLEGQAESDIAGAGRHPLPLALAAVSIAWLLAQPEPIEEQQAEPVGSDGDSAFPGPPPAVPAGPQDPVHPHPAVAPGGLGYLMTLSHEEEEQIEWGSKSAT